MTSQLRARALTLRKAPGFAAASRPREGVMFIFTGATGFSSGVKRSENAWACDFLNDFLNDRLNARYVLNELTKAKRGVQHQADYGISDAGVMILAASIVNSGKAVEAAR